MIEFKTIVVKKGQSLLDISMQEYGNIEGVFAIMVDNYQSLNAMSDVLKAGTTLRIRKENIYGLTTTESQITNSNPVNTIGNGYVAVGYVATGYVVSSITDIGKINKGISDYQLELIK